MTDQLTRFGAALFLQCHLHPCKCSIPTILALGDSQSVVPQHALRTVQSHKHRLSCDRDKSAISVYSNRKGECHSIHDFIGCLLCHDPMRSDENQTCVIATYLRNSHTALSIDVVQCNTRSAISKNSCRRFRID